MTIIMQQSPVGGEGPEPNVWWALAAGYAAGSAGAAGAVGADVGGTSAVIVALVQGVIGAAAWVYVQRRRR
ncbi:hypothetical protein [Streptomyces sp. cg35]|uniref:hypothetical protein n=1 Tax=Streptomyces sp. cg35 TaxID=3421650 RepID=UPI003D18528F